MAGIKISDEHIRRTRGGVPLSDHELDLTVRAAQQAGMTRGAYWRKAILEAAARDLGEDPDAMDTARRPAPRQPRPAAARHGTTQTTTTRGQQDHE